MNAYFITFSISCRIFRHLFDLLIFSPLFLLISHLFAIASAAYSKMIKDKEDQVIVIWWVRLQCLISVDHKFIET